MICPAKKSLKALRGMDIYYIFVWPSVANVCTNNGAV